mgnify:CR=1 FL=1
MNFSWICGSHPPFCLKEVDFFSEGGFSFSKVSFSLMYVFDILTTKKLKKLEDQESHTVLDRVPKEDAANFESAAFL